MGGVTEGMRTNIRGGGDGGGVLKETQVSAKQCICWRRTKGGRGGGGLTADGIGRSGSWEEMEAGQGGNTST